MNVLWTVNSSALVRTISWWTLVSFALCQLGCTPSYVDTNAEPLEGDWKPVLIEEIVGSEDELQGERVRLHIKRSGGEIGTSIVVVERIDSTFVYAWSQMSDNSPRQLSKIKLQRITQVDLYNKAAGPIQTVAAGALFLWVGLVVVVVLTVAALASLGD